MANYRRAYSEEIFNCFPKLNQPIFTPFGSYIVDECDPNIVEDRVLKVLKTILSPKAIVEDPNTFHILAESKMTVLGTLMSYHFPPMIKAYHINSILLSRADCGPLKHNSLNNYLSFNLQGRKAILKEAFLLSLPDTLQHSEEWVDVESLISSGAMITDKAILIREFLRQESLVRPATAEIEIKRAESGEGMYIRCTGKMRRQLDEESEKEEDDWPGSWKNIGVFDTLSEAKQQMQELDWVIYHLPSNAFIPLPAKELFSGATILQGTQHGLLISLQRLVRAFKSHSSCTFTKITVRESGYTLPIYNIPGTHKVLYVAFVRIIDDLEQRERKYYNMPLFLYDSREYNIRIRGNDYPQVNYFFDKIDVGAPYDSLPDYDCCEFELFGGFEHGCFQSADEECSFPEHPNP